MRFKKHLAAEIKAGIIRSVTKLKPQNQERGFRKKMAKIKLFKKESTQTLPKVRVTLSIILYQCRTAS